MTVVSRGEGLVEGKVALVTGAGSGIGRATALLLAQEGASAVVVCDIDADAAQATAEEVLAIGAAALGVGTDVGNRSQVDALLRSAVDHFGRVDCAVNNAGVRGRSALLVDYTDEDWRSVMQVNLDGVFYCLRAELQVMRGQGGGAIVNVSSGTTAGPRAELGAYVSSKFGVLGLSRVAAAESARDGIRVNAVLPGSTRTPMMDEYLAGLPGAEAVAVKLAGMPQGRLGDPAEIAEVIVWLCSARASFVNAVSLLADGGIHSFSFRPASN